MLLLKQPSYLSLLKQQNFIPSLSYSFNAGSYYRSSTVKNAFTSLVFGGYDASRSMPNNYSFELAADDGRELVVGIQTITKSAGNSNMPLLPSGILAAIDSSQPNIWLPLAACQNFEQVFGIVWYEQLQMYLVNDTLHQSLLREDPSVVFKLGNAVQGGPTIEISLPYGAFDLTAQPPLTNTSTRYFPLKRASNQTQYTLGRAFLQEAYLTVDYERRNFSLSQAIWNDTAPADIIAIRSPSSATVPLSKSSPLSPGAIAGIAIGAVIILLAALAMLFVFRKRKTRVAELEATSALPKVALVSEGGVIEDRKDVWAEMDGVDGARHEIDNGAPVAVELNGRSRVHELYGDDLGRYSELGVNEVKDKPPRQK
jgi:Eukaryotic aspartyl protease